MEGGPSLQNQLSQIHSINFRLSFLSNESNGHTMHNKKRLSLSNEQEIKTPLSNQSKNSSISV